MSPDEATSNRRRSTRHRVFKEGRIVIKGRSTINCTIRGMSDTGAKLRLQAITELPEMFELLVVKDALLLPAMLAWQTGEHVGVHFTGQSRRLHLTKVPL
jgi:hypothetical protein